MCNSAPQDEESLTLEVRDSKVSYIETKNTPKKKQQSRKAIALPTNPDINCAASPKKRCDPASPTGARERAPRQALKEKKSQTGSNPHSEG